MENCRMAGNSTGNKITHEGLKSYHSSLYKRSLKTDNCRPHSSYYWSCWKKLQSSVGVTATAADDEDHSEKEDDLLSTNSVAIKNKKLVDEGLIKQVENPVTSSVILFGKKHAIVRPSTNLIINISACCKDLERAASNGHSICLESLLQSGADVNKVGQHLVVPLISAVKRGHYQITKSLVNAGAGVNITGNMKETALIEAARIGHERCLQLLLENGADVNAVNSYRDTALHAAALFNNCGCVSKLISAGADVNIPGKGGLTPSMTAVKSSILSSPPIRIQSAQVNIIEQLVIAGADINAQDINGQTVFMTVIKYQNSELLKFLTTKGADVNLYDLYGDSALSIAVNSCGNYEIVKHLLQVGACVNCNTLITKGEDKDL